MKSFSRKALVKKMNNENEKIELNTDNKATEYALLIWDVKPEDFPSLGSPDRDYNVETLPEAISLYEKETDVFAKELHHYYEVDSHGWESSSNVIMEWDAEEEDY